MKTRQRNIEHIDQVIAFIARFPDNFDMAQWFSYPPQEEDKIVNPNAEPPCETTMCIGGTCAFLMSDGKPFWQVGNKTTSQIADWLGMDVDETRLLFMLRVDNFENIGDYSVITRTQALRMLEDIRYGAYCDVNFMLKHVPQAVYVRYGGRC